MKTYGQFCPIAKAAELFCERWTALVIRNVGVGAHRFSDIHRGVPLMSATLLSTRLKQLEAEGILAKRRSETGRSWTYHLTEAGQEFLPLVMALGAWGRRWTRRELAAGEMDHGLLVWGLEHAVDPAVFAPGRVTVELAFTDLPEHKARLWFVNQDGKLDLCVTDPGYEVDLWLAASLKDMIHVYRGDIPLARAIEEGQLKVDGPRRLTRRLGAWLNLNPLSEVEQAAGAPACGPVSSVAV